eukprot:TRINITY_DN3319_c1_g1_i1.p2 TRINITY_DN3319_c1_g1~~TRINITY_DN3319_c1_g1_i1.p2  ORF type:complete len:276 (+),score=27.54 TRINITY_DN3319_c1_g1_i1:42-869(+)
MCSIISYTYNPCIGRRNVCFRPAAQKQQQVPNLQLPQSKDEMLQQVAAVVKQASKKIGVKSKGFGSSQESQFRRLMIESLVQDAKLEVELLQTISDSLPKQLQPTKIACGNDRIVKQSNQSKTKITKLNEASNLSGVQSLIIGNTTVGQLNKVYQLLAENEGVQVAILVNCDWCLDPPQGWEEFCESFQPIYVFRPLEVKGFIGQKTGFMFKNGIDKNSPYSFCLNDEKAGKLIQVGQQVSRPSSEDIETVMYNASAADSPINKGLQWMQQKFKK